MKPKSGLTQVGVAIRRATSGTHVHAIQASSGLMLVPKATAAKAHRRFRTFVEWVAVQGTTLLPNQRLIACCVAFEGIARLEDLKGFLGGCREPRRHGGSLHVTWKDDKGRTHRRALSSLTAHALNATEGACCDWAVELKRFAAQLPSIYKQPWKETEALQEVLHEAGAWLYLQIPNVCFAHVAGYLHLEALPTEVWDREGGRLTTVHQADAEALANMDGLAEVKDAVCDLAYSQAKTTSDARILSTLKEILATSTAGGLPDTDRIARDKIRTRLQDAVSSHGHKWSAIDATLVSWLIFLLEYGSVRLRMPKVSTIRRYIAAAAAVLHRKLHKLSSSPAESSNEEWKQLFKDMLQESELTGEVRCALASFHHFLVSNFGIEPMPHLFRGIEENCVPTAMRIHGHEITRAHAIIRTSCSDKRLRQMLKVMLTIGTHNKVRIGELRWLRIGDVRVWDDAIEIEVTQGKSSSARRTLHFTDQEARDCIQTWLNDRIEEGAESKHFLFGDPFDEKSGYRLGTCQRLLNQALKMATGDASVSFHALRHSRISEELLAALLDADTHRPISSELRTTVEAGHRHTETTYTNYFHLLEAPIRYWIDVAIRKHLDSAVIASRWLKLPADRLRQGRHRAKDKTTYLTDLIRSRALNFYPKLEASAETPAAESFILAEAPSPGYLALRRLVADIAAGRKMSAICTRNSTDEEALVTASRAISRTEAQINRHKRGQGRIGARTLSPNANPQACLEYAHQALKQHKFCFEFNKEPHLSTLLKQLDKTLQVTPSLKNAARSWLTCWEGGISLVDPNAATPLLQFLHVNGMPADNILIRTQQGNGAQPDESERAKEVARLTAEARSAVEQVYSAAVQLESVAARADRPDVYMIFSRQRLGMGKAAASASCRMNRFAGMLFVIAVWCELVPHLEGEGLK